MKALPHHYENIINQNQKEVVVNIFMRILLNIQLTSGGLHFKFQNVQFGVNVIILKIT